jgi:hypothetical protein
MPYHWVFEFLAPVMEVIGWGTMAMAALLGILSREFFIQFLLFGYAFATMISIGAVLLEEMTYRRYNDWRDLARLIGGCFLEHFPYRPLHTLWRIRGIWEYLRGDFEWHRSERTGLTQPSDMTDRTG